MATATVAALEQRGMVNRGGLKGQGKGRPFGNRGGLGKNQRVYCWEEGHWKNECCCFSNCISAHSGNALVALDG